MAVRCRIRSYCGQVLRVAGLASVCFAWALSGCVTEIVSPPPGKQTTLVVTRVGDQAILTWKPEKGIAYVLMCRDDKQNSQWKPLPGAQNLQSVSGEQFTITDQIPPGENRYYRLQVLSPGQ